MQRAAGLVTDLSGVIADVVSEKGSAPGMAVLHVTVYPDKSPQGDFSIDNYGNRYLGYGEEKGTVCSPILRPPGVNT